MCIRDSPDPDQPSLILFFERAEQLHGEERIALGVIVEIAHQPFAVRWREGIVQRHERIEISRAQAFEIEPEPFGFADQGGELEIEGILPGELIDTVGHENQPVSYTHLTLPTIL